VADEPVHGSGQGWLTALYRWLGGTPVPATAPQPAAGAPPDATTRIGHYTIARKLGAGGMGVVYAAHDTRLDRPVALKMMRSVGDETARKRFWREARAAASVNHPNICQIYEVGEDAGNLFIAMELLDGEALAEHMRSGPLSVDQAVPIVIDMLAALAALHARGVVHRDLKPSNVFLTRHGVKLLDFGLARPELEPALGSMADLTGSGIVLGTPRYMAPEQVTGDAVDSRADLFAVGAILFEMLSGRPAFGGKTVVEVLNATLNEQPPALTGSPAVAAVDRVIRRALAKKAASRPASAEAMIEELHGVRDIEGHDLPALARTLTRVVVLPFRVLRSDPETDFLAFSLPDAITTSLAGIGSLVVRSSATAARFAGEAPDIKALAAEADVDRVVTGTLLRSGDQLRATAQLVEAPGGTLLASHTVQSTLGDLFRLQDDIARRVVEELALPLAGERSPSTPDAPRNTRAYELYLRGNQLARTYDGLKEARGLYQRCLDLDPAFAPAWAQLGRCHRVIGKFIETTPDSELRAEESFRRAIALNPRLSVAHKYYAALEADTGRTVPGMVRLLGEATRHGNDPELFSGLVHACRYCGLFEESIAAHAEACRLDPNVETSFEQTLLVKRDVEALVALDSGGVKGGADQGIRIIGLGLAGRRDEARRGLAEMAQVTDVAAFQAWTSHLEAWLDRRPEGMLEMLTAQSTLKIWEDPEAIFQEGWFFCDIGEYERGLAFLQRAVARGYFMAPTLSSAPQFDALRGDPAFQGLLADAVAGRQRALTAFREAGGERLLGR
jgi:serine/threonine protein kinase/tetratricopeptide (TPR) repeat protein